MADNTTQNNTQNIDNTPTLANKPRGAATYSNLNTGNGGYNVNSTQYPEDLFNDNNQYGGNYVIFYINIQDDSRVALGDSTTFVTGEISPRLRGDLVGMNLSKNETAAGATLATAAPAGVAGALSGAVSGFSKGGFFGKGGAFSSALKQGGLAALGAGLTTGAGAELVAQSSSNMSRQQKRLETAIALHVPNQLNIRYTTQWQDEETFAFQAGAIGARMMEKDATPENWKGMGAGQAIAASLALQKTPVVAGALSAASGLAANPKKEQVFKNVSFREFSFDYTFSPRSSTEAAKVREIIKTFKFHMHPEYKDYNNFIYIYPSEFDIFYYQNGKENLNLHRHTSCVLKDMSVNYTPNGMFNTFDDGMPTQINVTLNFVELAILTKQNIKDNF
jgi:hypothetical protein